MRDWVRFCREMAIHRLRNTGRGNKVRLMQLQLHLMRRRHGRRRLLHNGAARDSPHGRMIHGLGVSSTAQDKSAGYDWPLRD